MSISSEMLGKCDTYCEHGGVCVLDDNHKGKHSSDYCTWTSKQSVSKSVADARLKKKTKDAGIGELGEIIAKLT